MPELVETVRVDGLRARLGRRQVLDGLSLAMRPGVYGLLGPNGAGKTTLMRILATVREPQAGTVRLCGYDTADPAQRTAARARLGYLPQTFGYYRGFTVTEFVEYLAWLKQVPRERVPAAVGRAIERVGLSERARSTMKTLSGGMCRRVGIAQALVNDPDVLLLDEPTAGLDPQQRVEFRKLLRQIGLTGTVIVSTHLVEDVAAACGQVTLLEAGRLAFTGSPDELADLAGPEDDAEGGESALERGYAAALAHARERVAA